MAAAIVERDRMIVLAGLAGVTLLSWAYMVWWGWEMQSMYFGAEMAMPRAGAMGVGDAVMLSLMWTVMMVAMMTPTAAPVLLVYNKVQRRRRLDDRPWVPTSVFLGGYLVAWAGYSVVAAGLQVGLHEWALLPSPMAAATPALGGVLLILAGVFQWTSLKDQCLSHCRTPTQFLMSDWRDGRGGAFVMGLEHGWFCIGCCWILMALMFVAGAMNLLWMAAITLFVLVEKVAPKGEIIGRVGGVVMIVWGGWLVVG